MFKNVQIVGCLTLTQRLGSKQNIMKNFNDFIRILRRLNINIDSYFWTKEFTKNGQRHLHIIFESNDFIHDNLYNAYAQKLLSDIWRKQTKGESFRVWINEDIIRNAAGYAMKYLTKAYSTEFRYRKHEHRYGFSRNAPIFIPDNFKKIEFDSFTLEYHAGDYVGIKQGEKPKQK